uniref:Uncharacterized protein n=1 Tax=Arundo donax TaxID=35708 RepID=A0A0A8Y4Y1_ARUDO
MVVLFDFCGYFRPVVFLQPFTLYV